MVPALGGLAVLGGPLAGRAAAVSGGRVAAGPIVKPLPPEVFISHGTNAETRWEALREVGFRVPNERFFVRNHTATPLIDAATWRLRVHGSGVRRPGEFGYAELRSMPSVSLDAAIECAGNGRSFYGTQQGQQAEGTPWRLGGIGVARWRGVPLGAVLRRAGLSGRAVEIMPSGLDADFVSGGQNLGHVRRPLPIAKALDDVLLAYEMNGEPLPPDHGFPVRVVVPSWIGIASIKWVGDIEVSAEPLVSPWNTQFYRFFGPGYPPEGSEPLATQVTKSAFELAWEQAVPAGGTYTLRGRSWSGRGRITRVEVSTDGGARWRPARLLDDDRGTAWTRWRTTWAEPRPGRHELLARATDETGAVQPARTPFNTFGYLFGAVVAHPVRVA
ncbi:sulfite oxidase [Nonomuraea sp. NPDC050404]|uniref:sulfite oxidase n=1 Tax=Nonomuraea sp. NPDC050404 TaxID=3155783 RepID=UPI0033D62B8E